MIAVLLLFLIPVGGGIPAGVLLARSHHLAWPTTAALYFVSDVILALLFEPILRLLIAAGRKMPRLARVTEAVRLAMKRNAAFYGAGAGPISLILISFSIDPMTGRTAAAAAGHGFVSGWSIAITGDMLYFAVIMAATLQLNAVLKDPAWTITAVLTAMMVIPVLVGRWKKGPPTRSTVRPS